MKKKIALFQNDLGVGGIQKSLVNLLQNFDYERFDVDLYLSERSDFWDVTFPAGVTVRYLEPVPRLWSFLPFDLGSKAVRFSFPAGLRYDLAADFNSYQFSCAAACLQAPARRRVMWIHNDVGVKYRNEWKYRVLWRAFRGKLRHFDGFVPVSRALIAPFERLSGVTDKPFTVIPNYIDVKQIRQKAAEEPAGLSLSADCLNFVALGRLCHQKGYDLMLEAFAAACRTRRDLRLYILGDGPDRQALEQQAKDLGLDGKAIFLGNQPNPYAYMARMDAFVSTSRYEGQPLNIMEARAVGLPLYCTKNLEAYSEDLRGYADIAAALAGARKEPKRPDGLEAYNRKILDAVAALAGEKS